VVIKRRQEIGGYCQIERTHKLKAQAIEIERWRQKYLESE
jgi:hypothetical protein